MTNQTSEEKRAREALQCLYLETSPDVVAGVGALMEAWVYAEVEVERKKALEQGFYEGYDMGRIRPELSPKEYCKLAEEFAERNTNIRE